MKLLQQVAQAAHAVREFIAPTYRPECHYMRGPGPACARRAQTGRRTAEARLAGLH